LVSLEHFFASCQSFLVHVAICYLNADVGFFGCEIGHNYIGTEHLLLGLLREGEGVAARVLENLGADPSNIRTQVIRMVGESTESVGAGVGGGSSSNKMPTLEEYGTNLTKLAEEVWFLALSGEDLAFCASASSGVVEILMQ
jgi:hypothetical protein